MLPASLRVSLLDLQTPYQLLGLRQSYFERALATKICPGEEASLQNQGSVSLLVSSAPYCLAKPALETDQTALS